MKIIYDVKWSQESIYDVVDILDYVEIQFGKIKADEIAAEINAKGARLCDTYNQHSESDILYEDMVIRKQILGPSILFYTVNDKTQTVYILRVLRHERDWKTVLEGQNTYTFYDL